jgi:PPM family protein phosphatase
MRTEAFTHVGLVRKGNEDSYLINGDLGLFVVADGMGGHEAGEVASMLAVKTLEKALIASENKEGALKAGIQQANSEIYRQAQENPRFHGMGTTITAVHYFGGQVYIGHVGDSRAYLIRGGQATLLTRDHSLVNELLRCGQITQEEAENHPQKHIVTRALGTEPSVEVDILSPVIEQEDKVLLCSDGLSNLIKGEEIAEIMHNHATSPALQTLKQLALDRGGFDNITALLVEF